MDSIPVGFIITFPVSTVPTGYLECNGQVVLKTSYPDLYTYLKDSGLACIYGDSGNYFYLPDLRGRFIRGWDHGVGRDPDAASRTDRGDFQGGDLVGTIQDEGFKSHRHSFRDVGYIYRQEVIEAADMTIYGSNIGIITVTMIPDGTETRPKNIYVMHCIKYTST
jgi:hypothetical protein